VKKAIPHPCPSPASNTGGHLIFHWRERGVQKRGVKPLLKFSPPLEHEEKASIEDIVV
jgi:hypothetical protein